MHPIISKLEIPSGLAKRERGSLFDSPLGIIKKTREDYNKIAKHFSGTRYDVWPELEQLKPLFQNGQYILDWGCGNGRLLLMLREMQNIHYVGVDQSEELIAIARRKHTKEIKGGQAHFYSTAKRAKKFPDNYFDIVCCIASFHHLPDEASRLALLTKIYAELKSGGKLVVLVWNLGSDWAKAQFKKGWKKIGDQDFLIPWKTQKGEIEVMRYYHHFIPNEIKALFTKAGFITDSVTYGPGPANTEKGGRNMIVVAHK